MGAVKESSLAFALCTPRRTRPGDAVFFLAVQEPRPSKQHGGRDRPPERFRCRPRCQEKNGPPRDSDPGATIYYRIVVQ